MSANCNKLLGVVLSGGSAAGGRLPRPRLYVRQLDDPGRQLQRPGRGAVRPVGVDVAVARRLRPQPRPDSVRLHVAGNS